MTHPLINVWYLRENWEPIEMEIVGVDCERKQSKHLLWYCAEMFK
jgi:hypothetical protein